MTEVKERLTNQSVYRLLVLDPDLIVYQYLDGNNHQLLTSFHGRTMSLHHLHQLMLMFHDAYDFFEIFLSFGSHFVHVHVLHEMALVEV